MSNIEAARRANTWRKAFDDVTTHAGTRLAEEPKAVAR